MHMGGHRLQARSKDEHEDEEEDKEHMLRRKTRDISISVVSVMIRT